MTSEEAKALLLEMAATAENLGIELPSKPALKLLVADFPQFGANEWREILRKGRMQGLPPYGEKFFSSGWIQKLSAPAESELDAAGRLAWEEMLKFRRHLESWEGNYWLPDKVLISDRIARAVRLLGGWTRIVRMTNQDWPFLQKEFLAHYRSLDAMCEVELSRPELAGLSPVFKQLASNKKMP